jgi:NitT/TauT family transport system ATP-binding protein
MMTAANSASKIAVSGFRHFFDTEDGPVQATGEIDLTIGAGEFVTLVGPSGCGKTTLLKAIAGFIRPTEGTIYCDGTPVNGPARERGVVFQELAILPWRTVWRNIGHGLEIAGIAKAEREHKIARLIDVIGLRGFEHRYPHELSGGMRQRVNIARALVMHPQLLLLDEPFAALDAQTREFMQVELLKILARAKTTALFITHQINEAVFLSTRVVVMSARPARIKEIIDIDLPPVRTLAMKHEPSFLALEQRIWRLIEQEAEKTGMLTVA